MPILCFWRRRDGPWRGEILGSLSTRVFETRTATGSEPFSLLTCLHTTAFALPSTFSPLEMLGIKIWETPMSWYAKCPLPVVVRVSKTCVLKLPIKWLLTRLENHFESKQICFYSNLGKVFQLLEFQAKLFFEPN